jgi:hypothetical protein
MVDFPGWNGKKSAAGNRRENPLPILMYLRFQTTGKYILFTVWKNFIPVPGRL